jgi:hypothetical protein
VFSKAPLRPDKPKQGNSIMTYEEVTDKTNDIVTNGKYQEGIYFMKGIILIHIPKVSKDKVTTLKVGLN